MPIPLVDRTRIGEVMAQFDRNERSSAKWEGWEKKGNHKYAITNNDRLYPVKEIVAEATGVPTASFGGGSEANDYIRKLGFKIEPLDLPTETEVQIALHDLLLAKAPQPVEPSEAYDVLADQFELPKRLREKPMENSDRSHWQNRVRFARRKLVDAGVIDPAEHGAWQLKLRSEPKIWIEKSLVKGRPDRIEGEQALGRALWSPIRGKNGSDVYRNMRFVQPNDVILHLTDNSAFTGASIADAFAKTDFIGVDGTNWEKLKCYRIKLRAYHPLDPPLEREELISSPDRRDRLIEIRRRFSNLFYDPNLELHQGGYLTEAPTELFSFLDGVYRDETGQHLAEVPVDLSQQPNPAPELSVVDRPQRIWLYAPGNRAGHWDEFRQSGIAAIGWDELGDLKLLSTRDAIKARMDEVYEEPRSLVDATQCFEFAHRMRPGDWIFAKKGRREIVGWGVIKSDYWFDQDREYFQHVRKVEWKKSGSWAINQDSLLAMKTVTDITDRAELVDELEQLVNSGPQLSAVVQPASRQPPYSIEEFSAETAIPPQTITSWDGRLKRKQHMIFQGPPGTGKTFVAERMARLLTGNTTGFVETLQFHPSYSYEDFMQGIRPVVLNGQLNFERAKGRFLLFCERARAILDGSPCVLIVDEINRANLSRVFGELMYLLEYRDKAIPLAGEDRPFSIPSNVYLIGTMNTADRSIALVDHALRRRFSFIHLGPDYDVLQTQLDKCGLASDGLVTALRAINATIDDRNYEIGISFFLKDGAGLRATLRDVWEGEIEPYLEEYFYDQPGKLEPLRWTSLVKGPLAAWSADRQT
jgi:hypothetical protein